MNLAHLRLLSLILLSAIFIPVARAQDNATINGTVQDSSGAVISNAEIDLTNLATDQVRHVTSNGAGDYRFANVGVGHHTLSVSAPGFQKYTKTGIVVNVAQTLEENVVLAVGSQGQTVTVEANALQVQSETSELSNLISGQQVTQLATNGRNLTALATLGMGVSANLPDFNTVNANTSGNGISFNGTRANHNVYLLDGAEMNDRGCGGCFDILPSLDALAEFQTLNSNYSPDYGIGSGGTILMVVKSGSRDFHGGLWEFNRNEAYDANNYFSNLAGQSRPKLRLNEFGGNLGGPLWIPHIYNNSRKRTFFFVNEEWRKLDVGSAPSIVNTIAASNFPVAGQPVTYNTPSNGSVPLVPMTTDPAKLALYQADNLTIGQPFPNNTIPANLIDPNAVLEMNANTFPKPNFGASQYVSSIPQPTNVREDVLRIDHAINSKLQLMGHYVHDAVTQTTYPPQWGDSSYPTSGSTMLNPAWMAAFKLTQMYSPSLLNETAFNYSDNTVKITPVGNVAQPAGWTATTFFPLANNIGSRMPEIDLGAPYNTNWSSNYFPWKNFYASYQIRDDLSWTKGKHQFKFGFSYLRVVKNQQLQANTQGTAHFDSSAFSGDSYINFLLGDAASFTQLQYLANKHWVNNNYGFYGNDNWHVTPRLTLNLGLRYDGIPHAFERFDQFANFVPGDYSATLGYPLNPDGTLNPGSLTMYGNQAFYLNGIKEAGVGGFPRGAVQNKYNTWQPRVGFAYDLSGDGKTVFRGGLGVFYERVQGNDVYNAAQNPPFAYQPSATNVYFSNPNTSAISGVTTTQAFPSTLTNLKYNYPPPGTTTFSLGLQRQLAQSVIAVLQYGGSTGWDQNDDRGINTLPLTDPNNQNNPYDLRKGVANGSLNANLYRIYPGYSSIVQEENETNFNYHSLQTGLRVENRHGFTVQLAYTWSHEIDDGSGDLNSLSNPFNAGYDRGSGSLDRRHIFTASYIYSLPFFAHSSNVLERSLLGGWEFSGITIAQSGTPQSISYNGADTLGLGGNTNNRPNLVGKVTYPKKRTAWFNTSAFASPIAPWNGGGNDGFGDARKDAVVLPGRLNFNLSLFKSVTFTPSGEGPSLQLRLETFNAFNHTQFKGIDSGSTDSNFGQVTSAYDPRVLQLGAKFRF
ncbi:MAG TPA: TonB-dependent receptor [Edaphobacter sp.]|uniref:TonB-dependent receptor n=1 Tax=Edaphobacter sp. TaxID=1934404 RepID=UPI002B78D067|nr:TonB-dependent receptor [Edaphobacter sp.]HUZ93523.1 TonB-dependent receptor [Edaphobacter sp.]